MKNYFILFVLLIGLNVKGQSNLAEEFVFNRLIQYEEDGSNQIQVYFNIDNSGYFLLLNDTPNEITAKVYDKAKSKIHYYNVKPLQESNGLIYEYKYKKSEDLVDADIPIENFDYRFDVTRDDKYYQFSKLDLFYKDGKTKPFLTADLSLRYHHENLFPAFNLCCLLGSDHFQNIKTDSDFVVVKADVMLDDDTMHTYRLVDDQLIQFKLRVPKSKK